MEGSRVTRRSLIALTVAGGGVANLHSAARLQPLVIAVQVMFDRGAHSGSGLTAGEISLFRRYQENAARDFTASGIRYELHELEGAYLRQQGYSEIPDKFLVRNMINLFVTASLGYDIDRDRTGGCSIGPRKANRRSGAYPFYETYIGLKDARETTLEHEYAHQFTLDTLHRPTAAGNFWADMRNDWWLWRQRHGAAIPEFRACVNQPWARLA